MLRLWIGTALLAGSWLLGLNYFYPASPGAGLAAIAAAVVLLSGNDFAIAVGGNRRFDELSASADSYCATDARCRRCSLPAAAIVLLLPAVWFAAWPYRAAPLLLVLGLGLRLLPIGRRWSDRLSGGAVTAGVLLLVQSLALELYAGYTASSHDLPVSLADLLGAMVGLLGIDATADGSNVVMHSMRQVHRFAATWELLVDPATFLFFVGGLTMLALRTLKTGTGDVRPEPGQSDEAAADPRVAGDEASLHPSSVVLHPSAPWSVWLHSAKWLALIVLAWLPLRAGLLTALYLHRVLRSDPNRPLHAMNHVFSPWMLLLLLVVPVLLAWRFIRIGNEGDEEQGPKSEDLSAHPSSFIFHPSLVILPAALLALAVALFTAAIYWNPVGARREGRVMVVERHSEWSPTTKPYDTKWFAEPRLFGEASGYNYAAIYDYLGQFYRMSRLLESDKIDDQTLAKCDVLVIKIPTSRYSQSEAEAVTRFVERGGGLLLIGDHTNFESSATAMNDVTRPMGFIFRDDMLFTFDEAPDEESYERPLLPHPSVQHVPRFDWAVSCSIDPGHSRGRSVITSTGLWSMGPEYHHENFMPIPQHCPEMRGGAFVQAWAARHGQGRAIAFTDSTIFSNFCTFQPGKAEMALGMVEWLNHDNPPLDPRPWLLLLGLLPLAAGLWTARRQPHEWLVLLASATCGWVVAGVAVAAANHAALPTPKPLRPQPCVVIDRNTSAVPLAKGMFNRGDGEGYGMLEASIARLGCYTVRKEGPEAFSGDALVVICPSRPVSDEFRERLKQYVADGGRLLVIDSPENVQSRARDVLWPFGISIHHDRAWKGQLGTNADLPAIDVARANEVAGGQPVARLAEWPVAAAARFGKGSVLAVAFGSLWNDNSMGEQAPKEAWDLSWNYEPNATVRARYDLLFGFLRSVLENKPLPAMPLSTTEKGPGEMGPQEQGPKEKVPAGLKESGPAGL